MRYEVRCNTALKRGDKRWIVWDTAEGGWADDAHTRKGDAQEVCDELNAAHDAAAAQPEPAAGRRRPRVASELSVPQANALLYAAAAYEAEWKGRGRVPRDVAGRLRALDNAAALLAAAVLDADPDAALRAAS